MLRHHRPALWILLAALPAPVGASAQEAEQSQEDVQQWVREIQQLQSELEPVQQEALQDSAIQQHQEEIGGLVRDAMIALDSTNALRLERMGQIIEEAQVAQSTGDTAKIDALTSEAETLQPHIEAAQAEALAQPEIETRIEQFRQDLHAKMIDIDPEAKPRLDRLAELSRRVQRAMGDNS
jgi:hypothetical protein